MILMFGYSKISMARDGKQDNILCYAKEFSINALVSGKPLRNFEQKKDMTRFLCLRLRWSLCDD